MEDGNSDILIKDFKNPFGDVDTKEEFIEKLKKTFSNRVHSLYLFGSINTPEFNQKSDIDIIIITETIKEFHSRILDFPEIYTLSDRIDCLIYTPREFDRLINKTDSVGFWANVKKNLVKII
jgi:predicted nucleotidyltransferase